jgi:hypothetical protein
MRKVSVFAVLFVLVVFLMARTASADPRMEIKDNFCHCILEADDTDNEVFIADCAPVITVEKDPETLSLTAEEDINTEKIVETEPKCEGYVATGYFKVARKIRESAAPIPPGESRVFNGNDYPGTDCVMVESNGDEYRSNDWKSVLRVKQPNEWGVVKVIYELTCYDGNYIGKTQ